MAGDPVHVEISSNDSGRGREFWGSLFGWQFEPIPGPFEYHMARISDQAGAAIMPAQDGKLGIRTYFDTPDVNASAARVRELGGQSSDPLPVPGMGAPTLDQLPVKEEMAWIWYVLPASVSKETSAAV